MLEVKQQKEKVNLETMVKEIVDLLEERIKDKNAEVVCDSLPEVYVIPSQFRQMLQNLISNALKFTRKEVLPNIKVSCKWINGHVENIRPARRYLQLTVCDNGIGIEEEYLESIFDLFKRLHPKAEYEGSGLGLAITKRIVDNHEGQISVTSDPGKGSCFYIIIPQ